MKPRFCTSPVGVTDAVETAWRTYSMLYDRPGAPTKLALEAYVRTLIYQGRAQSGSADGEGASLFEEARGQGQPRSMTAPRRQDAESKAFSTAVVPAQAASAL